MRGFFRGLLQTGLAVLTGVSVVFIATPGTAKAQDGGCRDISVPLTSPGLSMHGVLCQPTGASKNVAQVLVPGGTYNQVYWNFTFHPNTYNFRLAMNRAGFTTLTLDRLGTGASSRPPSATLTSDVQARAVHEVIQALRHGQLGQPFDKVIIGGHSLGSAIAEQEAATYHDVDAVLLTGVSHHINTVNFTSSVTTSLRPAALDPRLGKRVYDTGYLTTVPGTRAEIFYAPGTAEPGVAEADEATKDVFSTTETPDAVGVMTLPLSRAIDVPVMLANGAHDPLACGAGTDCTSAESLARDEGPYFAPAARLHTYSLPDFGHDINLAPNTADYQQAVIDWATSVFTGGIRG